MYWGRRCILLKFYIKPQQRRSRGPFGCGCILLKFYIKPQPTRCPHCGRRRLYLIEILHQTTTIVAASIPTIPLYLIEILHQTTTAGGAICSISVLYAVLSGRKIECRTFVEVCLMRFFVFQRTKIPFFQKNSNCCGMSGFARSLLPQKLRMSPYCLSVTDRILVNPAGGIDRRTRLM